MWLNQLKNKDAFGSEKIKYQIHRFIPKNIFVSKSDHISNVDVQNYLRITDAWFEDIGSEVRNIYEIAGITSNIPLGIIPEDGDCANAALFLVSDLSKVITGAGIDVNGGEVTF